MTGIAASDRIYVRHDGEFEISGVPEGNYVLTVMTLRGDLVQRELLTAREGFNRITISLPNSRIQQSTGSGVVSFAQLKHKVPKEAQKYYKEADKRYKKGDLDGSLALLKRATEIDPEYVEALNNLGCRYMMKDDPENALAAYRRASELDAHAPLVHANMAIALLTLKRHDEAESAARKGLEVDPADPKARYLLGVSLYMQRKYTDEAVDALRRVSQTIPHAYVALAATLAARGGLEEARTLLNSYINSGHMEQREQAKAMLLSLR
jgi:tetratricopeptide (TPR) repeat protein